jgi:hypothetical protein
MTLIVCQLNADQFSNAKAHANDISHTHPKQQNEHQSLSRYTQAMQTTNGLRLF